MVQTNLSHLQHQRPMFETPEQLQQALIKLYPPFSEEVEDGYDELYNPLSYHHIWMEFAPISYAFLCKASTRELKEFCSVIERSMAGGEKQKNAVSTCFLEHGTQLSVKKLIKSYLSEAAKAELK